MRPKFILLAFLSVILFTSCIIVDKPIDQSLNGLKRPLVLIAKTKFSDGFNAIVIRTGNDSLVSYSGRDSEMIQAISESLNINDTIN